MFVASVRPVRPQFRTSAELEAEKAAASNGPMEGSPERGEVFLEVERFRLRDYQKKGAGSIGNVFVKMKLCPEDAGLETAHGWKGETRVVEKVKENEEAVFDAQFNFPIQYRVIDSKVPFVKFDVIKDKLIDTKLGTAFLDLAPLALHSGQAMRAWLPLGKDGEHGELLVKAKYFERPRGGGGGGGGGGASGAGGFSSADMDPIAKRGHAGKLLVKIVSVRNLRDVENFGKQDPFVRLKLRREGGRVRGEGETKPQQDAGKGAYFEQDFPFSYDDREQHAGVDLEKDAETPVVEVEVLDFNDKLSHTPIGRIDIPVFPWYLDHGHMQRMHYPLHPKDRDGRTGEVEVELHFLQTGALELTQEQKVAKRDNNKIFFHFDKAEELKVVQSVGQQDPYVKVSFHGTSTTHSCSPIDNAGENAVFDQMCSLQLQMEAGVPFPIRVEVRDKNGGIGKDGLIGAKDFNLSEKAWKVEGPPYEEVQYHWIDLLDKSKRKKTGRLRLRYKRGIFDDKESFEDDAFSDVSESSLKEGEGKLHIDPLRVTGLPGTGKNGVVVIVRGQKSLGSVPRQSAEGVRDTTAMEEKQHEGGDSAGNDFEWPLRTDGSKKGPFENHLVVPFETAGAALDIEVAITKMFQRKVRFFLKRLGATTRWSTSRFADQLWHL